MCVYVCDVYRGLLGSPSPKASPGEQVSWGWVDLVLTGSEVVGQRAQGHS